MRRNRHCVISDSNSTGPVIDAAYGKAEALAKALSFSGILVSTNAHYKRNGFLWKILAKKPLQEFDLSTNVAVTVLCNAEAEAEADVEVTAKEF